MAFARPDAPSRCTWQKGLDFSANPHTKVYYTKNNKEKILPDVLHAIGNTPLIKLNRIPKSEGLRCEILAKCEFMNPGGSVKDRIAVRMIEDAEKEGLLKPGDTLIESTAGNTGIGLAMAAAVKGYHCKILMSTKYSSNKIDVLKALGAEIIRIPAEDNKVGTAGSEFELCKKLQQQTSNSFIIGQFTNKSNPLAHYDLTAMEIYDQCDGQIDMVVLGAGTGGTITGIGRRLKQLCPNCLIVGADVVGSVLSQTDKKSIKEKGDSLVEGIGFAVVPTVIDRSVIDFWVNVSDAEAFAMARRLQKEEGLLCGGSGGAALAGAIKAAERLKQNQKCVIVLPDGIRNYMDRFIADQWLEARGLKPCINLFNHWWWDTKVTALNLKSPRIVNEHATCAEALNIMEQSHCEYIPVINSHMYPVGVVNASDVMRLLLNRRIHLDTPVFKAATKEYKTLDTSATLGLVSRILEIEPFLLIVNKTQENGFSNESITYASTISGVVTRTTLLQFITDNVSLCSKPLSRTA